MKGATKPATTMLLRMGWAPSVSALRNDKRYPRRLDHDDSTRGCA